MEASTASLESTRPQMALTPVEQSIAGKDGVELTVLDDGRRMWRLTPALAERMNLLTAISSVVQVDGNWTPVPRAVQIRLGKDTFKVGWDPKANGGKGEELHSIVGSALNDLAEITGIEKIASKVRRIEGGLEVNVMARMRRPDGLWRVEERTSDVNYADRAELLELEALERWEKYEKDKKNGKPSPTARDIRVMVLKDKQFLTRRVESQAYHRCIRALLGIETLPASAFARPFLGISWYMTPDWSRPETKQLVEMQFGKAATDLYGAGEEPTETAEWTELEAPADGETQFYDALNQGETNADGFVESVVDGQVVGVDPETGEVVTADPEEWDEDEIEDNSVEDAPERARPERDPVVSRNSKSGFASKPYSEIVRTLAGRSWLLEMATKSTKPDVKALAVAWLNFQEGTNLTVADLG